MKKNLTLLFAIFLGIGFLMIPGNSQALILSDIGTVDQFIAKGTLGNSSEADELAWVNATLGLSGSGMYNTEDFFKDDEMGETDWTQVGNIDSTIFAYNVSWMLPDYFLIKTGNIGEVIKGKKGDATPPSPDIFLYKNLDSLEWAVIDLNGTNFTIKNIGKISHIDTFGTNSTPVPEPATMLLLGSGLIGLAGFGRKKFKK